MGFGEVDMCIKQHCNVLMSCFQSDGQGITLILMGRTEDNMNKEGKKKEEKIMNKISAGKTDE